MRTARTSLLFCAVLFKNINVLHAFIKQTSGRCIESEHIGRYTVWRWLSMNGMCYNVCYFTMRHYNLDCVFISCCKVWLRALQVFCPRPLLGLVNENCSKISSAHSLLCSLWCFSLPEGTTHQHIPHSFAVNYISLKKCRRSCRSTRSASRTGHFLLETQPSHESDHLIYVEIHEFISV